MNAGAMDHVARQVTVVSRRCANGETPAGTEKSSEVIPCQAVEDLGSTEGVETRKPSSNGNASHERPASYPRIAEDEDIVRHPDESPGASLNSSAETFARSRWTRSNFSRPFPRSQQATRLRSSTVSSVTAPAALVGSTSDSSPKVTFLRKRTARTNGSLAPSQRRAAGEDWVNAIMRVRENNEAMQATAQLRSCANGETLAGNAGRAIPCHATEDLGSVEGVETRGPSSNGNVLHECPTPHLL